MNTFDRYHRMLTKPSWWRIVTRIMKGKRNG